MKTYSLLGKLFQGLYYTKDLIVFIINHFNSNIKFVRTNNAKKLSDEPMAQLYRTFGIVHKKSCVETPQQNGIVERKHRQLIEL